MPHPEVDVRFDHTIIAARDKHESARFFTGIFGLPEPREAGFFVAVQPDRPHLCTHAQQAMVSPERYRTAAIAPGP